jgi:hypothetical protein
VPSHGPEAAAKFWQKTLKRLAACKRNFIAELRGVAAEVGAAGLGDADDIEQLKLACRRHPLGKLQSDALIAMVIAEGLAGGRLTAKPRDDIGPRVVDPWEAAIAKMPAELIHATIDGRELVTSGALLAHVIGIPRVEQKNTFLGRRLRRAMEATGWNRNPSGHVKVDGRPMRGYWRYALPR